MSTSSELTSEDHLRLSVLMAQVDAVRVDEGAMCVLGRAGDREWTVQLHPRGAEYRYLHNVRCLLSEIVLGQPSGFPVYIKRWSDSGALSGIKARQLLKLGEPEAVRAVARLPDLEAGLAELAWWADPSPEVARTLLAAMREAGPLGCRLAEYLVDHLAFENDPEAEMETVRQLLRPGLLNPAAVTRLWSRRESKPQYRVGFLQGAADRLPEPEPLHPLLETHGEVLQTLRQQGNAVAATLYRLLDAQGQTFLRESQALLQHAVDQSVVCAGANVLGDYLGLVDRDVASRDLQEIVADAVNAVTGTGSSPYREVAEHHSDLAPLVTSLFILAGVSERIFLELFARSTASGSLLQSKLTPTLRPLIAHIAALRDATGYSDPAPQRARRSRRGK